jgi:nitrite reductase/ring-hydroxylating ferredoxin subunit
MNDASRVEQQMESLPDGRQAIIIREDGVEIARWLNSCPHVGIGLDYGDGQCLFDGHLVCSLHGAVFDPRTGECLAGPGQPGLSRLPATSDLGPRTSDA